VFGYETGVSGSLALPVGGPDCRSRPILDSGGDNLIVPEKMDPQLIARIRRQELEEMIKEWGDHLAKEMSEHQRRAERWRGTRTWHYHGDRWEQQAVDTVSLWDLVRRGLDPRQERRFRGRVALTVRCEKKGHVLALVYPTCACPVFVPSVRCLPVGSPDRWKPQQQRAAKFAREYFPWAQAAVRDPWIEEMDEDESGISYYIRGLTILTANNRRDAVNVEGREVRPTFFLLCRCGQQLIAVADVMRALDRGDAHLTAVYTDRPDSL
jgi:hypothetical protein